MSHQPICAIFATDQQGGMGLDGRMPWPRLRADLEMFKARTLSNLIVMGSKTWLSKDMANPLPGRTSAVWTRQSEETLPLPENVYRLSGDPAACVGMMDHLVDYARTIYVIGGAETLRAWMPVCQSVYHTQINHAYGCDTVFHNSEWQDQFELLNKTLQKSHTLTYSMSLWTRKD